MTVLPNDDDELVSAYLDGEATPDEVARVESAPVLLARVETFRAAIGLTAQPVPPAPSPAREAAISAALAAADEVLPRLEAAGPAPPPPVAAPPPAPVIDLAARRKRANFTWLAAAAVAAVALVAVPLVLRSDDDTATTVAAADKRASTTQRSEEPGSAEAEAVPEDSTAAEEGTAAAATLHHDLGEFVTWTALKKHISERLDRGAALPDADDLPCPAPADFTAEGGGVAAVGPEDPRQQATWYVGEDEETGERTIVIVDADCDERVRAAL